jgi:hypothetical protein
MRLENGPLLFTRDDLRSALEGTTTKMVDRLNNWDPDALLNAAEADVVEELIDDGSVQCPRLLRDQAWMPPPGEVVQTFMNFGRQVERRVPQLTLIVPFEGEKDVFLLRASQFTFNPPRVASLVNHELRITVEGETADLARARTLFDTQIDAIEKHLAWSRQQIEQHNQQIRISVPDLVSRRRTELLTIRNLQAAIGYPIRRRPDADTYTVPVRRRTLRPAVSQSSGRTGSFQPEPVLAASDYEAALDVLRNSRNALERTPSLAEGLDEELIRDLLLINLNAQFEGDAAGEVFNGYGKTDILIRVEDRNIFIGECKVWAGPKTMDDALEQLFKYLVWRDTKAAILLFIRNKDVTAAVEKAVDKIEAHPNFKRRGTSHTDERLDFVMHADGDPQREINLALLPFALRTKE